MSLFELHRTDHPTPEVERAAIVADPVFGKFYADHMAVADYTEGLGWRDARIIPTGQWQLHPAAAIFHYHRFLLKNLRHQSLYCHPLIFSYDFIYVLFTVNGEN